MFVIFQINGGPWTVVPKVTAACVGNAKYFGGGMKIAPTADPFDGSLEVRMHFTKDLGRYCEQS